MINNILEESKKVSGARAYLYEMLQGLVLNDHKDVKVKGLFKVKFEVTDFKDHLANDILVN
jgi:hypothetical protein